MVCLNCIRSHLNNVYYTLGTSTPPSMVLTHISGLAQIQNGGIAVRKAVETPVSLIIVNSIFII